MPKQIYNLGISNADAYSKKTAGNVDHGKEGFVGGSPFWVNQAGTKPLSGLPTPPGTPAWGSKWKAALAYCSARAIREQYLKNPGPLVQA